MRKDNLQMGPDENGSDVTGTAKINKISPAHFLKETWRVAEIRQNVLYFIRPYLNRDAVTNKESQQLNIFSLIQ